MPRNAKTLVQDMLEAAEYLAKEAPKTNFDAYQKSQTLQFAFLHAFTRIGEALARLRDEFPDVAQRIDEANKIIGFRNVIVHQYWNVDDKEVWSTATTKVEPLVQHLQTILADLNTTR